ncbi:Usher syndrome 2A (autosomal recessive, mild) [Sparganum proliferum]
MNKATNISSAISMNPYQTAISGPSVDARQEVEARKKSCTFSDLPPFTNFTVRLQLVFKNDSRTPDTTETSATTWPTVGQKVENLRLTANEPRSIHVNWEPPTSPQGIIHNYKVLVKNKGTGASQKHAFLEPGQRLENLDPSTTYIISVAVRNYPLEGRGGGYGEEVSDEATTLSLDIERPTDVRAIAINSDSVRLTWRAPAYKLSEESGYSLLIVGPDFNKSLVVGKDTLTHKFSGLQPSTEYTLYVQVIDSVMGQRRPMGSSLVMTNSAGNVNGLSAYATATSSDAIYVAWKRLQNYRVEDIRHYAVSIFGPSIDVQQLVKGDGKSCTFSDLPPFTNFTVLVELIFKDDSWNSDTTETSATTWPTVGQKVENLRLTANEPRSIHVNWEPPTSPQGIIHNYKVLVKNKGTGASQKHAFLEPGQRLENLDPSTTYIISVAVRNYPLEGRGGGYGEEVSDEATTLSLDIERPTDVRAIAINSDSVRLTWRAPAYKLSEESGYSLLIVGPDFNKSLVVGKDTLTHKFSGLQPSTEYTLYVQVIDSVMGQRRPMGSSLVITNSAGNVNGLSAYATATSSDAIYVAWKRLQNYRVEDIRHYAVSIFGPSIDVQQLVKGDGKSCTFSDLPPFTNFTVLVELIFKDDSWNSDTTETSATTWPTVGQKVENLRLTANEPRSIHVNWEPPTSPQGIIHNYKVLVKNKGTGASQKHAFLEPGQRLENLDPSTTYIISVAVRNYPLEGRGGGYGEEVSDEATTLSLDREVCGRQSHAPVQWPALQSTRHESNQHSWPWNITAVDSSSLAWRYSTTCSGFISSSS